MAQRGSGNSGMRRNAALLLALLAMLPGCGALFPRATTVDQRLAALPRPGPQLARPVTIRWNDHLVPWIEAENDTDLAYALGMVHGHLRGAQVMIMRMIARGRLAEMAGPLATDYDHALRILDFGKAAPEVVRNWPPETRAFVEHFLAGLNRSLLAGPRPPEAGLLGLDREPITAEDLVAIGRLAGTDINWLILFAVLQERGTPGFAARWQRLRESGAGTAPPEGADPGAARLTSLLRDMGRNGSNTVAVSPARSASGAALLANDPHLGLNLPNLWLIVGMRSPSLHAVGLMVPGLPIIGIGRTPDIAWGGTNLRSAASDLFDVSRLPPEQFTAGETTIRQRLWFSASRPVRTTPLGPVMTDAAVVPARPGDQLALRWVGHEPTDEITALLRAARARSTAEFRTQLAGFGVSPQNFLYVDRAGNIARSVATILPSRPGFPEADPVLDGSNPATTAPWQRLWHTPDLPGLENPPDGLLASANENPALWAPNAPPIGFVFSDGDRVRRLRELVTSKPRITPEDLMALQADTRAPKATTLAAALLRRLDALPGGPPAPEMLARLRGWDGDYAAESEAALVFELILGQLAPALNATQNLRLDNNWGTLTTFLLRDLDARPAAEREALLRQAVERAAPVAAQYRTWGEVHRLRAAHWLVNLPVLGRNFVLGTYPVGGSRETPMKSGHGFVTGPHEVSFGSMARHVSDMADPDANWFTLWGGQDGWLGSAAFASQVPLWRDRQPIRMPLRPETVVREFPRVTVLTPDR